MFAITVQSSKSLDNVTTETAVSCLNFNENTEGAIVGDPIAHEVNSHDVFDQNIVLVNYKRKNNSIEFSSCQDYNINSDSSSGCDLSVLGSYIRRIGFYHRKNRNKQQKSVSFAGVFAEIRYASF